MPNSSQAPDNGLISAYRLDGSGGGTALDWRDIQAPPPSDGVTWIHLDLGHPGTVEFVREQSGLDEVEADVLLAERTRPRMVPFGDALVVI